MEHFLERNFSWTFVICTLLFDGSQNISKLHNFQEIKLYLLFYIIFVSEKQDHVHILNDLEIAIWKMITPERELSSESKTYRSVSKCFM